MRLNGILIKNNINDAQFEGSFDLSAAAAVTAARGDEVTAVTKTGTGEYRIRIPAAAVGYLRAHETIFSCANVGLGGNPATAVTFRVFAVTNDTTAGSTLGDILIDIRTGNASYVATDTTAAITISWRVTIRTKAKV